GTHPSSVRCFQGPLPLPRHPVHLGDGVPELRLPPELSAVARLPRVADLAGRDTRIVDALLLAAGKVRRGCDFLDPDPARGLSRLLVNPSCETRGGAMRPNRGAGEGRAAEH